MAASRRAPAPPLIAYVLHHWDWSETSLIVDLFTRSQGRIAVAAKGAKRPTSQLRPVLLPFQRLHVSLGRSRTGEAAEVQVLRHAEWAGGAPMLCGGAIFSGLYCNELLMRLLARDDAHPGLFDAYAATLPLLAASDDRVVQAGLRAFELMLLHETGVLPDLGVATLTVQPVAAERGYELFPESGVCVAPAAAEGALTGALLVTLQAAIDAGDVAALQQACLTAPPALRTGLRTLLQYHLGHAPLQTRQVMQGVQRLLEPGSDRPTR
jgi:DNA repair protein RecO (recombination protein O)